MAELASGSLTPYQHKKLSRRLFFPVAATAAVGGGIALYEGREAVAEALENLITGVKRVYTDETTTNPNLRPATTIDPTTKEIGGLINAALVEISDRGRGIPIYRAAYQTLGEAAVRANNAYQPLSQPPPNVGEYMALEITARMWQSLILLNQAGRNIILPGESINVESVEPLVSGAKLGASFRKFNYLKALEHYENTERLLGQAKSLNINLPTTLSVPLHKSNGAVAEYGLIYKRMLETITALLEDKDLSAKYRPILQEKKAKVQSRLDAYSANSRLH